MPKETKVLLWTSLKNRFAELLLDWNIRANSRQMPWKGEKDPYKIWLSEIILQQTRVEQGLSYYKKFISSFPTVDHLAGAGDEEIFKHWEGLGYYTRCRNLILTARKISGELKGRFPDKYEDILALKGIGPYTAAAISSFAFNLPHAVVDGNVFRVLARVAGISEPVDSTEGKKIFTSLAGELLDKKNPGVYNQAIMDFGATICKPVNPLCGECVFRDNCYAFQFDKIDSLPVRGNRITIRRRWFNYMVISYRGQIALRQRKGKDIWQDLYEFPMIESMEEIGPDAVLHLAKKTNWLPKNYSNTAISPVFKQQLTHQLIKGRFIELDFQEKPVMEHEWIWVTRGDFKKYSFPRFINQYLEMQLGKVVVK